MIIIAISFIISILVVWIVASIPLWLASKVIVGKRSSMGQALASMMLASIVFFIYFFLFSFFTPVVGGLIGFIGVLGVFKSVYRIGWLESFYLAIIAVFMAVVIFFILNLILFVPLHIPPLHVIRILMGL